MKDVELVASYWTLAGQAYPHTDREYSSFDFRERVEVAAEAGFKGIGIWHADLDHILESRTLKEMKQILDDNDMKYVELEFLVDWFMEGERKQKSDVQKEKFLIAAEALQARHIKVGDFFQEPCPMQRLIDTFGELCKEAAEVGSNVVYEFMPFTYIKTVEAARQLVEGVGANNGGVILDLWHMVKLGISYEELGQFPAQYILGVELDDGYIETKGDLHDETINHRKLCGEGEFDIAGFIDCMDGLGYDGPYGIEVLSAELRERPLQEIVSRSFNTTMEQFRR